MIQILFGQKKGVLNFNYLFQFKFDFENDNLQAF